MGLLFDKFYPCGKVLQGNYEGKYVYCWDKDTFKIYSKNVIEFSKIIGLEKSMESLYCSAIITCDTVENYEIISENQTNADAGTVAGATLLFGVGAGILASQQGKGTNHFIAIGFKDGKRSLLRLNEFGYEKFLTAIRFKIKPQKNKIKENSVQVQSPFSVADELKKFKELLDMGVLTQEEFDVEKERLLNNPQKTASTADISDTIIKEAPVQDVEKERLLNNPQKTTSTADISNTIIKETPIQIDENEVANSFIVEDVFFVTNKGLVACGEVSKGQFNIGDKVSVIKQDGSMIGNVITGIEKFREITRTAKQGDNVGLVFQKLSRGDIEANDIIIIQ